ncbi:MAG: threonine/serine exporter family protein [Eubacteriales bacterium]|nr:threonine/serine exporter family protein [Eubacteriales bacterium]
MMTLLPQFLLALFATLGFTIIFRVPVKKIPACIVVGAFGWITYLVSDHYLGSPVVGCFLAACIVGLFSFIAATIFKDATTIFEIPGILCLVPGSKIFYTMEALLNNDLTEMGTVGLQTLLMAGAIAMGLLVMGAVIGIFRSLMRMTVTLKEKF